MKLFPLKNPPQRTMLHLPDRQAIITGLVLVIAVGSLLLATGLLVNQEQRGLNLALLALPLGLPVALLLVAKWRWSFYGVILLLVFEGMIRNLLNQASLLLIKDGVIFLMYLGCLAQQGRQTIRLPKFRLFLLLLFLLTIYSLAELLNPALPGVLVGLIGLKSFLFYIPLLFVAYWVLDTPKKITVFTLYVLVLANISCFVALFQHLGGYEVLRLFQPVQIFSSAGALGVYYKLPGTFAAPGNLFGYLSVSFVLAMGLLYSQANRFSSFFAMLTIGNICLIFVLGGQRATWVFIPLCFFLGTFLQARHKLTVALRAGFALTLIAAFVIAISSDSNIVGDRFSEFVRGDAAYRYFIAAPLGPVTIQLKEVLAGNLFGSGVGTTAPGARYVQENAPFVESFIAALIYELGPIGLLLVATLIGLVLFHTWQAFLSIRHRNYKNRVFFIFLWLAFLTTASGTYAPLVVPPAAQFFWLLPGLVLRLQQELSELDE